MVAETAISNGLSDGNLATTYALVYSFLTARSHAKAAAAVKKAAKDIIVLKDEVAAEENQLDEIIKWWKLKKDADVKHASSPDSNSNSSSDDDSSDSSSGDLDSSADSDSSKDSLSSSWQQLPKYGLGASKMAKVASVEGKQADVLPNANSTSTGLLQDGILMKAKDRKHKKKAEAKSNPSPNDSSTADSNSSSSAQAAKSTEPNVNQTTADTPSVKPTVGSVPTPASTTARTTKKRRISESGNAVATAVVTETVESSPVPNSNGKTNGKKPRKSNVPFQRIKAETVEFHDERLKDNAFVAKGGTTNDYGARANQDLIVTRGDGFRKEKNKKKRGSYRGGEITMESHSIKFN